MRRPFLLALLAFTALGLSPAPLMAQAKPPLPMVVLNAMNALDGRCSAAGGKPGTGRYVIAQDFTGDGLLDYLLSEGDYDCRGRPGLFRTDGEARVDLFVTDRANRARRVYSERLIGYRVLAGRPARLQVARRGAACGAGAAPATRCAGQLAWNGSSFGETVSVRDGDPPASAAAPPSGPAEASQSAYLAQCRKDLVRRDASASRWADDECRRKWGNIENSGSAAEMLLAVIPASAADRPSLAQVRQRATGVRWAARPAPPSMASGRLGELDVAVEGRGTPSSLSVSWSQTAGEIPHDVVGAMRRRGVSLVEMSCEKTGVGAGTRVYAGTASGRAPFTLTIEQQTAPLGHMQSYYVASLGLGGRHPPRGTLANCEF